MDCNLPRSSIHGLFQARVLEWVAISFSRGTSQPRNRTWVSHIVGRCFTIWTTRWILNHWHTREVPILFLTGKPEPSNIIKSAFIWLNVQWRLKIFILKEKCRKSILFFFKLGYSCFPGGSDSKESACNAGDLDSIPGLGRSPGEGNGYPLQYSYMDNPMDRGTWHAAVHGVTKSQTRLSDQHFDFS